MMVAKRRKQRSRALTVEEVEVELESDREGVVEDLESV